MVAEAIARAPFIPEAPVTSGADNPARPHLQVLPDVRPELPRVFPFPSVYDNAKVISRSPGLTILELDTPKHIYGGYNLTKPGMLAIFLKEAPQSVIAEYHADQKIIENGGEIPKQRSWILGPW